MLFKQKQFYLPNVKIFNVLFSINFCILFLYEPEVKDVNEAKKRGGKFQSATLYSNEIIQQITTINWVNQKSKLQERRHKIVSVSLIHWKLQSEVTQDV